MSLYETHIIEGFLKEHPDVEDCQVVVVPDPKVGEELFAWIILKDNKHLTEDMIKDYFKGKLSPSKMPRYFQFVDEYPRTTSGKIQKLKLKENAEQLINRKG
mgnify:CR=1 FL=1